MSVWAVLEIEPTNNVRLIKKAYAVKLKVTRPEDDSKGYQALREAFDTAKRLAKQYQYDEQPETVSTIDSVALEQQVDANLTVVESIQSSASGESQFEAQSTEEKEPVLLNAELNEEQLNHKKKQEQGEKNRPVLIMSESVEQDSNGFDDNQQRGEKVKPVMLMSESSEQGSDKDERKFKTANPVVVTSKFSGDETAVINSHADSNDKAKHDAKLIEDLLQSIHDCLNGEGQVAAVQLFYEILNTPELESLDMEKKLDLRMISYLNWLSSKRNVTGRTSNGRNKLNLKSLPLGFMRQIIKHYQWHKRDIALLNQHKQLEQCYDSIMNECGIQFLQRMNEKKGGYRSESSKAAKDLLGTFNKVKFRIHSINAKRRDAVYQLLESIESMDDASFDFELNTESIKWWRERKNDFMLSGWMFGAGLFFGFNLMIRFGLFFDNHYFTFPLLLLCSVVMTVVVYWFAYARKVIEDFVAENKMRLTGLEFEIRLFIVAILLLGLAGLLNHYYLASDFFSFMLVCLPVLIVVYRYRVFGIAIGILAVWYSFNASGAFDVFNQFQAFYILLPVLVLNTLIFGGCIHLKEKQSGQSFSKSEIPRGVAISLNFVLITSCFIYGVIATGQWRAYINL